MKISATVAVSLKRLLDKRRRVSTVCLFLLLVVSSLFLSLLCLRLICNLQGLDALRADYDAYVHGQETVSSSHPFRIAARSAMSAAFAEIVVTHVLLLLFWLIPSVAGVGVMLSEAIGGEAYVYALYVIYGADPKRLRRQIYRELCVVSLPALGVGLLLSWGISCLLGWSGWGFWMLLEILALYGVMTVLCAGAVTRSVFKRTCVSLLEHADMSAYIGSPRRSFVSVNPHRRGGLYYALLSLVRMRKYHLPRALAISLVAAMLFLLSGLTLPDTYGTGADAREYTLTFSQGVSGRDLQETYLPAIEYCDGVVSAEGVAGDAAHRLGTHMLLEKHELGEDGVHTVYTGDKWAFDTMKIACADGDAYTELGGQMSLPSPYDQLLGEQSEQLGYRLDALPSGTAVYVHPAKHAPALELVGSLVEISLPDGAEGYDPYGQHITVEVVAAVEIPHLLYYPDPRLPDSVDLGARITEDYLFLSAADYGVLCGEVYAEPADAVQAMPDDISLAEGECYLLLPPAMMAEHQGIGTLTLITPEVPSAEPFTDRRFSADEPKVLPMDQYYINHTIRKAGVYLGSKADLMRQEPVLSAMSQHMAGKPISYILPMVLTEYDVAACRSVEGLSAPCVVFVMDPYTTFTTWDASVTALGLTPSLVTEEDHDSRQGEHTQNASAVISGHRQLYFAAYEGLVLQTNDRDALREAVGDIMYIGTDVPDEFYGAMDAAGVPVALEPHDYQLTGGWIEGVFDLPGGEALLIWQMSPTSNLAVSHYPPVFTGRDCYLPVGDTQADSIRLPADMDVMLVSPRRGNTPPVAEATCLSGDYAFNDFYLCPDFEMADAGTLSVGAAALYLPQESEALRLEAGRELCLGIFQPLGLALDDPLLYTMNARTLLEKQMSDLTYAYHRVTVTDIRRSPDVKAPTLVLSEADFCRVMDRKGAVTEIGVWVNTKIPLSLLGEAYDTLAQIASTSGGSLEMHDRVLRSRATGTPHYTGLLRLMLCPLTMLLPLLLLSSAHAMGLRRREEWQALVAAGGTRKRYVSMCLWEGGLKCLLYALCYLILCPVLVLLVTAVGAQLHMPFGLNVFSLRNCLLFLGILTASVGITSLLPLLDPPLQFRRKRNHKDSGGRRV